MNIRLEKITKHFNGEPAVNELTFEMESGQILGLLGPIGAGKTTTLRMILDMLPPDEGEITFDGKRINRKLKNSIGYLPEKRGIYQKHKVIDILVYFGRLKNMTKSKSHVEAVRLLDRFEMIDIMEKPVSRLSKTNQQKLQFLMTLLHDPHIVILDEPFWALEPDNQEIIRKKMSDLKQQGKLILLSTHQMSEAEALCDYFVLINNGTAVLRGTLDRIRKNFPKNIIVVEAENGLDRLQKLNNVREVIINNSRALLYLNKDASMNSVLTAIIKTVNITKIEYKKPSLNDMFLQTIHKQPAE